MDIELIIGLVVIIAWRIIAGMKIPVLSPILRAIWNLSFTVSSFIPFFGWAANFIIADTEAEQLQLRRYPSHQVNSLQKTSHRLQCEVFCQKMPPLLHYTARKGIHQGMHLFFTADIVGLVQHRLFLLFLLHFQLTESRFFMLLLYLLHYLFDFQIIVSK